MRPVWCRCGGSARWGFVGINMEALPDEDYLATVLDPPGSEFIIYYVTPPKSCNKGNHLLAGWVKTLLDKACQALMWRLCLMRPVWRWCGSFADELVWKLCLMRLGWRWGEGSARWGVFYLKIEFTKSNNNKTNLHFDELFVQELQFVQKCNNYLSTRVREVVSC